MSYQLSEAYENLYNPRVESFLDDNLRFIDFMEDEDIEEVVESIYWEIRDYGNSQEDAFDILSEATSNEILSEAYDEILLEIKMSPEDQAELTRRVQQGKGLKFAQRIADKQRRDARTARIQAVKTKVRRKVVDGPFSRAKAAFKGAKGGLGRAAKELGSKGAENKAKLAKLLRRGVDVVKNNPIISGIKSAYGASKYELSGRAARDSKLRSDLRRNVRNVRAANRAANRSNTSAFDSPPPRSSQPSPRVAQMKAAKQELGRGIASRRSTPSNTTSTTSTTSRSSQPNQINIANIRAARPKSRPSTPFRPSGETGSAARIAASRRPSPRQLSGDVRFRSDVSRARTTDGSVVAQAPKSSVDVTQKSSTKRKPTPMSQTGKPLTGAAAAVKKRAERQQQGSSSSRQSIPRSTVPNYEYKKVSLKGGKTVMRRSRIREDFNLIIEQLAQDLIHQGYTDNFDSALNIIDNLSEEVFNNLIPITYTEMSNPITILDDFTLDELEKLNTKVIFEGVNSFAGALERQQVIELIESIEEGIYVLSESNDLTQNEEIILNEILNSLKSVAKGSAKWAARGAGYLGGLAKRVGSGLARYAGSGYERGRTGYTRTYQDYDDDYENDRGFSGTRGIRAAIGRNFRQGMENERQGRTETSSSTTTQPDSRRERLVAQGQRIAAAQQLRQRRLGTYRASLPASSTRITTSGQIQRTPIQGRSSANITQGRDYSIGNTQPLRAPSITRPARSRAPSITRPARSRAPVTSNVTEQIDRALEFIDYLVESGYCDNDLSALIILENFSDDALIRLIG